MLFVAGRFRLSADSRFRFQLFASTTLNHKLKTVFPSTGATNPFAFSDVLWSGFFRVSEPKTDFSVLRCLGIFRVVTFQSKTGRFVARNFSRTRGKFDLRREATQGACPAPRAKKKKTQSGFCNAPSTLPDAATLPIQLLQRSWHAPGRYNAPNPTPATLL